MEDKKETKGCNGRCETCGMNQRSYCAAQKAYYLEQDISEIKLLLSSIVANNDEQIIVNPKVLNTGTGDDTETALPRQTQELGE